MERKTFNTLIPKFKALDDAFEPIQQAVEEAYKNGEKGAVFCQLSFDKNDGNYKITGAFYPQNKAKIIAKALTEVNKK